MTGSRSMGELFRSRSARTALLALALFLICVFAHAVCLPYRVDRLDSATVSREGQTLTIRASVPSTLTMDYCALNDAYSILPDAPTQGREGSGYLIRFEANTPAACGEVTYTLKF